MKQFMIFIFREMYIKYIANQFRDNVDFATRVINNEYIGVTKRINYYRGYNLSCYFESLKSILPSSFSRLNVEIDLLIIVYFSFNCYSFTVQITNNIYQNVQWRKALLTNSTKTYLK